MKNIAKLTPELVFHKFMEYRHLSRGEHMSYFSQREWLMAIDFPYIPEGILGYLRYLSKPKLYEALRSLEEIYNK